MASGYALGKPSCALQPRGRVLCDENMGIQTSMKVIQRVGKGLAHRWQIKRLGVLRAKAACTLSEQSAPKTERAESAFASLQQAFYGAPAYGYDPLSLWKRAGKRVEALLALTVEREHPLDILEVGCGDGVAGAQLACFGHRVTLTDMEDWRDSRAALLHFLPAELERGLELPDNSFDLLFSYNTFEHLSDPRKCLLEMVRLCRPDGLIHLNFSPLYCSPWGLHAHRTLMMPYPQFLFSEDFVTAKLRELGIHDLGRDRDTLQPLNKWRLKQFHDLWAESGCEILEERVREITEFLPLVMRFPESFRGRGLSTDDLIKSGIRVTLRKQG